MSSEITEIEARIRSLSPEDRTMLMRALIGELDGPADSDVEQAWLKEARRRHREIVDGAVSGVPGEAVFERLRSRLNR